MMPRDKNYAAMSTKKLAVGRIVHAEPPAPVFLFIRDAFSFHPNRLNLPAGSNQAAATKIAFPSARESADG
jgi:hypothetical protein